MGRIKHSSIRKDAPIQQTFDIHALWASFSPETVSGNILISCHVLGVKNEVKLEFGFIEVWFNFYEREQTKL